MGKVCRNIRAKWSAEDLSNALKAIERGLSQQQAATRYGIPRRTIRNHIKTGRVERKLGRSSILSYQQEKDLVARILRLAEVGYPVTPQIMRHQVFKFVKNNGINHSFNNEHELAGRGWFKLFMKRNPELTQRKAQNMNPARAQKLNRYIVGDYFKKLGDVLDSLDFKDKPERIYNMDEKGCRLTIHHQQSVLALKGTKRLHLIAPEHAENVTVVGCVSASGNVIPPMIIFKGVRLKPEFEDNLPAGAVVKMAPKGSMTTELFVQFIQHFSKFKIAGPVLLVFDGAMSHLDYTIVDEADNHNITLLCLPSNTTHELQPLDKSIYRSFEAHWDQEVLKFWGTHPDRRITKSRFNLIFTKVWSKCMTNENIVNGFRATGLYPYDESAIPFSAFAPSEPTERSEVDNLQEAYRTDISNTEDISEDELPLAQISQRLNKENTENNHQKLTFKNLMETPDLVQKKQQTPRRKSLNYKAQIVKKSLFDDQMSKPRNTIGKCQKERKSINSVASTSKSVSQKNSENSSSWYCLLCHEDTQKNMRQCRVCEIWAHDECLGYSTSDDEDYTCSTCTN